MKRISLLMALLLSITLGAAAQTVASSATSVDALADGYYVIRVKSNDNKATASYLYASDSKVYYDALGSEANLAGGSIDTNTSKYMFYITKNSDGTLKISLWNDHNTSWPTISDASNGIWGIGGNKTPGHQDQFTMNSSAASFTAVSNGDAYFLTLTSHYYSSGNKSCTGYVTLNDKQYVGYWDLQKTDDSYKSETNAAQVQFFAVSGTPLTSAVKITYNLQHNGSTLYTEEHSSAFEGISFPDFSTDLNRLYLSAEKPSGTISAADGDKTFNIELSQQELPFTIGNSYYLGTAGDNPVMIYNKSGMAYRNKAQAETLNDIYNDLWTISGNVFDGFQFTNTSAGNLAHSSYCIAGNSVTEAFAGNAVLAFSGAASNTYTWDICRGTNGFMIFPHQNESKNRYWNYNGTQVKFNNDGTGVKEFAFYEPEFTFPMYTVGNASYNSIALPFAAKLAEGESTKMYKGKVNEKQLDLTEVSALPAEAGVVLVGEANASTAKFVAVTSADAIGDNDLVGTTVAISNADLSDKLIFGVADDDANVAGFFAANSTATLNANHAYLLRTNGVKSLAIHFDGTPTNIALPTTTPETDAAAPVYDLSGRRVTSTVKGHLYIKAGRKFIAQ